MSDNKEWKWNPKTPYDEEEPETMQWGYNIWHDLIVTICIVVLVALLIVMASHVF